MTSIKLTLLVFLIFEASYAAKLGNRYFMLNKLSSTFGESSISYIENNILRNGDVFAGPCDPYKSFQSHSKTISKNYKCFNGTQESKYKYWAEESPVRVSLVNKTCSEISKDQNIIKFVKEKSKKEGVASYIVEKLAPFMNVKKKKTLLKGVRKFVKTDEVIYNLCKSPFWQYI
ncbi:MAG: hypothetical protein BM556_10585 [Bacteriovorax sp. MedPE-SWde]|nr:MAG: hypothetical protein BM556_10585 [Bacteriovorax sp. MedPE-SWde]